MTTKSAVLVSVQLVCIAVLVLSGPVIPTKLPSQVVSGAGLFIIVWAATTLGMNNLRVQPEPGAQATLVIRGPYGAIRHPMYTGGMLIAIGWVWNEFSVLRLIAALALLLDFLVKLRYEERLLSERFPEYRAYMRESKRLVPWVY